MANKITSNNWFTRLFRPTEIETTYMHKGEIFVVFLIAYLLALALWILVNMGRDYNLTLNVPLRIIGPAEDMVFAEQPPENARIGVSGEGWNLFSLYRNPPVITVPYDDGVVIISEIIKEHMVAYPDLTIQEIYPTYISVEMVPKVSKKVPVSPDLEVELMSQYEIMGDIRVRPDSVTLTGSEKVLDTIQSWPTELLRLRNVQGRVDQKVHLAESRHNISLDTSVVQVSFDVTEFTEGEIRVNVRVSNVPDRHEIRLNPSVITVRYDVPIEFYSDAQEIVPYEAIVEYDEIVRDTTGFVVPTVRATTDELNLRLRNFQPRRISYFKVIGE